VTVPSLLKDASAVAALDPSLRYHHLGIPTRDVRADETHLPEYGLHVSGFDTSPFGVEWMRFDDASPLPELVKTLPHVAFQVDDLEAALEGHEVLIEPNSPSEGVRVAFIIHDGAPVEFLEIRETPSPRRGLGHPVGGPLEGR